MGEADAIGVAKAEDEGAVAKVVRMAELVRMEKTKAAKGVRTEKGRAKAKKAKVKAAKLVAKARSPTKALVRHDWEPTISRLTDGRKTRRSGKRLKGTKRSRTSSATTEGRKERRNLRRRSAGNTCSSPAPFLKNCEMSISQHLHVHIR